MTFNLVHYHYVDKNNEQKAYATLATNRPEYEDPYNPFADLPQTMEMNTAAIKKRILDGLGSRSRGLVSSDQLANELGYPKPPRIHFRRVIQRAVRSLVTDGVIRRVRVVNTNALGRSRRYRAIQLLNANKSTEKIKPAEDEGDEEILDDDGPDGEEDDSVALDASQRESEKESTPTGVVDGEMGGDEFELVDGGEMLAVPGESQENSCPCCPSLTWTWRSVFDRRRSCPVDSPIPAGSRSVDVDAHRATNCTARPRVWHQRHDLHSK